MASLNACAAGPNISGRVRPKQTGLRTRQVRDPVCVQTARGGRGRICRCRAHGSLMPPSLPRALRLLHTSDWHIGQELHGHDRQEEHDAFLEWLIAQLGELKVDTLVVTGDIFDVANPPVTATARFYGFLRDALARHSSLQIVIVGGNHDSAARINLPGALLGRGRVHLVGQLPRCDGALDFDALLVPLAGRDGAPGALLAAIPYCRPGDLGRGDLSSLYSEVTHAATARGGRCASRPDRPPPHRRRRTSRRIPSAGSLSVARRPGRRPCLMRAWPMSHWATSTDRRISPERRSFATQALRFRCRSLSGTIVTP